MIFLKKYSLIHLYLIDLRKNITIENKNCEREKELYIFRDSYGSSLAPLLTEAYSKITIIDVRYIATPMLKTYVEFKEGADALFIYGVDVLNNSSILKVF